jgi:Tfp pilus assembly protein PilO
MKEAAVKIDLKNRQQLLGIVAAAAIGLFVADRIVFTPLSKSWKARAKTVADLAQKVASGRGLIQRDRSLRDRWEVMRNNTLPNDASLAEQQVLKAFDRWAQQSQLNLLSISPQWKHDAEDHMTLECRVEAAGNLNTVSRFLYELEKDPMALRLQAVEISARDNDGQQLALGMQVSALVLTAQEERGTAQAGVR